MSTTWRWLIVLDGLDEEGLYPVAMLLAGSKEAKRVTARLCDMLAR